MECQRMFILLCFLIYRAEIAAGAEREAAQANHDRVVSETAEKRNELEALIYDQRNNIGAPIGEFIKLKLREEIAVLLNEVYYMIL